MRKKVNSDPNRCKYCYLDDGESPDRYNTLCACGMKKCLYDCKTDEEKLEWLSINEKI